MLQTGIEQARVSVYFESPHAYLQVKLEKRKWPACLLATMVEAETLELRAETTILLLAKNTTAIGGHVGGYTDCWGKKKKRRRKKSPWNKGQFLHFQISGVIYQFRIPSRLLISRKRLAKCVQTAFECLKGQGLCVVTYLANWLPVWTILTEGDNPNKAPYLACGNTRTKCHSWKARLFHRLLVVYCHEAQLAYP